MDKQIIEISSDNIFLSLYKGFMVINHEDTKKQVPLDNILSIIISANKSTLSKNIIDKICNNGGNIVICGKNYSPSSIIIPISGHWLISSRIKKQINSSTPLMKNIWKNIIQNKISNQYLVLKHLKKNKDEIDKLLKLSKTVLSNDIKNNEAIASKIYFKSLFGKNFIRNRNANDINILLNYSYIVLRSMTARAITGNGLLPYIGIKHCSKSNPLPLVDDLMEPFRAIADIIVYNVINKYSFDEKIILSPEIKKELTKIVTFPVITKKGKVSLNTGIFDYVGSIVDSYENKKVELNYPKIIFNE